VLAENPEKSHNAIAKALQVSSSTVNTVCAEVSDSLTSPCTHGATGQGARTDRRAAPRPQVSKEEILARNAQIGREYDEERLSWNEISERDGLRPQCARDVNRIAMGAPDTPRARVRAHRSRLETQ